MLLAISPPRERETRTTVTRTTTYTDTKSNIVLALHLVVALPLLITHLRNKTPPVFHIAISRMAGMEWMEVHWANGHTTSVTPLAALRG